VAHKAPVVSCIYRSTRRLQPRCGRTLHGRPTHDASAW